MCYTIDSEAHRRSYFLIGFTLFKQFYKQTLLFGEADGGQIRKQ